MVFIFLNLEFKLLVKIKCKGNCRVSGSHLKESLQIERKCEDLRTFFVRSMQAKMEEYIGVKTRLPEIFKALNHPSLRASDTLAIATSS